MGQLEVGRVLADRYELIRPVGRGGMGAVWEARDQRLSRAVAVKVLNMPALEQTDWHRARFEREARLLAGLNSPYIAQIHDYGFDDAGPYLVQEFLSGEVLSERLQKVGAMVPEDVERQLRQMAKALRVTHDAGIVHRDLKPANIFLANVAGEDEPMVKLLDFGVAKDSDGGFTATGDFLGTLPYMSPEQSRAAKHVDQRADLWSLGVILFQMLTSQRPFNGKNPAAIMSSIRTGIIPAPSAVLPELGTQYDAFFEQALQRDPELRFSNVSEMVAAFLGVREAILHDRPSLMGSSPRAVVARRAQAPDPWRAKVRRAAPRFLIAMVLGSLLGVGARVVASAGTEPAPMPTIEASPELATSAAAGP